MPWRYAFLFVSIASVQAQTVTVCPRPSLGSTITAPSESRSSAGKLDLDLSFRTQVDRYGLTLYCYLQDGGVQAPTLRVQPGDELVLGLRNDLPVSNEVPGDVHTGADTCGGAAMTKSSTNLHFHGLSLPPTCHQDEVIHTSIQPSDEAFEYRTQIPQNQSPGLYWYHPHPHGFSEAQVLGGASGALIVEGIERVNFEVGGLPERVLILRDQPVAGMAEAAEDAGPGKDISINYVPVLYPLYRPAEMKVKPRQREFWRILNAAADTYFDLQLLFGPSIQDVHDAQPFRLIATDGVPIDPQAGDAIAVRNHILLSPGARAEIVVTTPPLGTFAQLATQKYDSGPLGASNPYRAIANIRSSSDAPDAPSSIPPAASSAARFNGLTGLQPAARRKLYLSETGTDPSAPDAHPAYFITVEGATPKVFDMEFKQPDIVVRQGSVEDWTVENRAREAHSFHIHQLHFQVVDRDGKPVNEPMLRDTIDLPYWDGKGPYPSVTLRMDFRSKETAGTFLYHCHILEHEDKGMMGVIRVEPARR